MISPSTKTWYDWIMTPSLISGGFQLTRILLENCRSKDRQVGNGMPAITNPDDYLIHKEYQI